MKKIFLTGLLLFTIMGTNVLAQKMDGVEVTDAGTFEGTINGKTFSGLIRYGKSKDLITIATGNKNFTLTINCKGISTISELKTGTYKLPSDKNITVLFVDNNAAAPCMVTEGTLNITENSERLKGSLSFTAAMGGIPKEMGGTETKFTGGSFEILKKK
jgi:hypothetical protein